MRLSVLLFASYAEAAGRSSVVVDLPENSTVADLVARLQAESAGRQLPPAPLVAVNRRHARYETQLAPGDEVAVIPPVAGG